MRHRQTRREGEYLSKNVYINNDDDKEMLKTYEAVSYKNWITYALMTLYALSTWNKYFNLYV